MEFIITLLSFALPFDLSGIVAGLLLIGTLMGLYIKQIKDVQEIKLTMKRDKEDTDKEIALLRIQVNAQGQQDAEIISLLSDIRTNWAVTDEKLSNLVDLVKKEIQR